MTAAAPAARALPPMATAARALPPKATAAVRAMGTGGVPTAAAVAAAAAGLAAVIGALQPAGLGPI